MRRIRVILAEDHHLVRAAVAELLAKEPDIEVVGHVADGYQLLNTVTQYKPDVLVLDAKMPGHKIIESAKTMKETFPQMKTLVLSAHNRREYVVGVLREGAAGYVLKDDAPEVLAQAIRSVYSGEEWISPRVAPMLLRSTKQTEITVLNELTNRERDVLKLMAHGLKNEEIAQSIFVTTQTIKNYVRSIFSKLDVNSRVEAVLLAIKYGLVDDQSDDEA
ncbi:MAG: response regulator transcription factor [Chloroflexi bacterium]|nr:response regulator transcription factor [Chloroflexota bacterium]